MASCRIKQVSPINTFYVDTIYWTFHGDMTNLEFIRSPFFEERGFDDTLFYLQAKSTDSTITIELRRVQNKRDERPDDGFVLEVYIKLIGSRTVPERRVMDCFADYASVKYEIIKLIAAENETNCWTVVCVIKVKEVASLANDRRDQQEKLLHFMQNKYRYGKNLEKLAADLAFLLKRESLSNIFTGRQGYKFAINKCILLERTMFFSDEIAKSIRMKVNNVTYMKKTNPSEYLFYIYCENFGNISVREAADLYVSAHYYGLEYLQVECAEFMLENLNYRTIIDVLIVADLVSDQHLLDKAIDIFLQMGKFTLQTNQWMNLVNYHWGIAHSISDSAIRKSDMREKLSKLQPSLSDTTPGISNDRKYETLVVQTDRKSEKLMTSGASIVKKSSTPKTSTVKKSSTPETSIVKKSTTRETSTVKKLTTPETLTVKKSTTAEILTIKKLSTPGRPTVKNSSTSETSNRQKVATGISNDRECMTSGTSNSKISVTKCVSNEMKSATPGIYNSKKSATSDTLTGGKSVTSDTSTVEKSATSDKSTDEKSATSDKSTDEKSATSDTSTGVKSATSDTSTGKKTSDTSTGEKSSTSDTSTGEKLTTSDASIGNKSATSNAPVGGKSTKRANASTGKKSERTVDASNDFKFVKRSVASTDGKSGKRADASTSGESVKRADVSTGEKSKRSNESTGEISATSDASIGDKSVTSDASIGEKSTKRADALTGKKIREDG